MTQPTTRLLDWNRSAVDAAVDLLTAEWDREGPPDWSDLLVLTQTKGAARRLRHALARHADEAGHGMFPPRFSTPSVLFAPAPERSVASEVACLLLWEDLVKETNLEEFDSLFPKPPEGKADAWARTVAKSLHGLRRTLSEADRDCGTVASDESLALQEPDRWSDLAKLEELYRERLGSTGQADPFDAKREAAGSPVLPAGIGRVMALGVSGFPGLAEIALSRLAGRGTPVEMVAFGPPEASFADLFDDWGRPLRDSWAKRAMPLVDDQLFLFPDERAQAQAIVETLGGYGARPDGRVALGVVDGDLKPYLKQFADEANNSLSLSDPEGLSPTGTAFYALLSALAGLVADPSYRQASAFLRFPEVRAWLESEGIAVGELDLFAQLDQLLVKRMPVSLADAVSLAVPDLRKPLQRLVQLLADLRNKPFASTLRSFLIGATGGREFDPAEATDLSYLSLSPTLAEALNDLEEAGSVSLDSAFPLLLDSMRKKRVRQEMVTGALPMLGWLELPWEVAPRLLLAGFNEGCVPDPVPGDAFLPENLRRELGLWTSEDRFSRDAYLLQWLLASRSKVGRVDLLLGKWRRGGDPLKPSRLLFLCDPADETALPARAKRLFRESARNENNPAWRFAWRLHPGPVVPATKISVTDFATFLSCPYRFHLKKRLGMESFDPLKKEGDAMDFGILVHDVLELFGKNKEARESSDASRIREFFRDALDRVFAKKYGSSPGLPLTQQKNSAWLRLAQAAEAQAAERRAGWVPIDAESWMSETLDGLEVRGRIDRIDRREQDGSIRVLDYKTSGKTPAELHWGPVGPEPEIYPDYSRLTVLGANGRELSKRWIGLQLPLYRWWAERQPEFAGADIAVGYFILPAERDKIGVSLWPELDDDRMAAAMTCAQGVVADLQAGWTGSPRAKVKYEDYEEIFFHDPQEATVPLASGEATP